MVDAVSSMHSSAAIKSELDRTGEIDFLRLLTVQLQNQDPLNPVDDRDFLSQMAQFSSLTELRSIRELLQEPQWQLSTLVGQQVTIFTEQGLVEGEVTSVLLIDSPHVTVNEQCYPLEWIVEVHRKDG